ncbi:MAG: SDR family oxidoreductase [Pseudomonadota bacterium]
MSDKRIAIVTGANRGLGLGTARALAKKGYRVLMVGRSLEKLEAAAAPLKNTGLEVECFQADVTRQEQIDAFAAIVRARFKRADVLVNNAGVLLEPRDWDRPELASVFAMTPEIVRQTYEVNTLGPFRMCQAFLPLMKENGYGRVANLSSGLGQLSEMGGYWPGYRMSKTALNALTRIFAAELNGTNVKVNSVCPGWVRTDMGGPNAERSIEQGIKGIVWAATLPDDGPSGLFFRDGKPIDW